MVAAAQSYLRLGSRERQSAKSIGLRYYAGAEKHR
jgi:hypothetical protein